MILVVTNKQDVTSDLVILRLQERGAPYFRFNTEDFLTLSGLSWRVDGGGSSVRLQTSRGEIDLTSIRAVWYRRPMTPIPYHSMAEGARVFAEAESAATLRNLWEGTSGLWVSRPERIRRAEQKLVQLRVASRHGLRTPSTLLTTDPDTASSFVALHEQVIAKPISRGHVEAGEESAVIYTSLLRRQDLARLGQVRFAPTLFQERVQRRSDIRVNVVGQRVFATEIQPAPGATHEVDWRRSDPELLPHTPHRLPAEMVTAVLGLVKEFGLQFGAIDLILTPEGEYVFLEINPNGQWAWIEQMIGTPISSAIADLLMGLSNPL